MLNFSNFSYHLEFCQKQKMLFILNTVQDRTFFLKNIKFPKFQPPSWILADFVYINDRYKRTR